MSTVPPIRREILVDADPAVAFDVFPGAIGQWWPLAGKSVHGKGATVAFDEGRLIEHSADGVASGFLAVTVRPWRVMTQGDGPAGAGA